MLQSHMTFTNQLTFRV